MNLSDARADAADKIRAKFPEQDAQNQYIVRVVEVDAITERDIPRLADGIFAATDATVPADRGPAAIAVMAAGRQESQAIDLGRLHHRPHPAWLWSSPTRGRGRGLATLDLVEEALRALPAHGLPELLVQSAAIRQERRESDEYGLTIHVYVSRCTLPPAFPMTPLAVSIGGAMDAIRAHVTDAVDAGLPADEAVQAGGTEADVRAALNRGLVPRARVRLDTKRETLGGTHDLAVIANQNFTDAMDRRWTMRVAEQDIVATVEIWHRSETLADEAIARVMGKLDASRVAWPGSFDALMIDSNGDYVSQRLTGGQFEQGRRVAQPHTCRVGRGGRSATRAVPVCGAVSYAAGAGGSVRGSGNAAAHRELAIGLDAPARDASP